MKVFDLTTRSSRRDFEILDYIVAAVDQSTIGLEPFCHLELTRFFRPELYAALLENLPASTHYSELRHGDAIQPDGRSSRLQFQFGQKELTALPWEQNVLWSGVVAALRSPSLEAAFRRALDPGLALRFGSARHALRLAVNPRLMRDLAGYRIGVHPDTPQKVITAQVYLPADNSQADLGTAFYEQLPSKEFQLSKRMRFEPNSGYAFAVHDHSWHGVDTVSSQAGERNSLMLIYYLAGEAPAKV